MVGSTGCGWSTPENQPIAAGPRLSSHWDQILGAKEDGTHRMAPGLSILYDAGNGLFCYSHAMLAPIHRDESH
jgi:hypothetical protein